MSLNTKTENVCIDKQTIHTANDEAGAIEKLHQRMKEKKEQIKRINTIRRINWARATNTRNIQSGRTTNITVRCNQTLSAREKYIFISLHNNDDKEFFIPSLLIENVIQSFDITIENKSTKDKYIKKDQPLGEMKLCSKLEIPSHYSIVTYTPMISRKRCSTATTMTTMKTTIATKTGRDTTIANPKRTRSMNVVSAHQQSANSLRTKNEANKTAIQLHPQQRC